MSRLPPTTAASIVTCDDTVGNGGMLNLSVSIRLIRPVPTADVRVILWDQDGVPAFDAYTRTQGWSLSLEEGTSIVTLAVGPLTLKRGRYALTIAVMNRANNLHLYWGDRVHTVEADGPTTAAVPYTPPLTCVSITTENQQLGR